MRLRKIRVMKIAIRDALPLLKRRVMNRYTKQPKPDGDVPRIVRRLAIAFLVLFNLVGVLYVLLFSIRMSLDVGVSWIYTFVLGESLKIAFVVPLRILILVVVLPTLVRQDVSVDRASKGYVYIPGIVSFTGRNPFVLFKGH